MQIKNQSILEWEYQRSLSYDQKLMEYQECKYIDFKYRYCKAFYRAHEEDYSNVLKKLHDAGKIDLISQEWYEQ